MIFFIKDRRKVIIDESKKKYKVSESTIKRILYKYFTREYNKIKKWEESINEKNFIFNETWTNFI